MLPSRDRSGLFSRYSETELLRRYRATYGFNDDITIDHVRRHSELEGALTDELIASTPQNRRGVFQNAYTRLYAEATWLAGSGSPCSDAENWLQIMRPKATVYEVGSGAGVLINTLGSAGFRCIGSDLSGERRAASDKSNPNVTFEITDGVNLSHFTDGKLFDYVISDQVVEHLHPDDIKTHFTEARKILEAGGSYIVRTSYTRFGPADLSSVFGEKHPVFMHLHEFTYDEMSMLYKECGFSKAQAIFHFPKIGTIMRSGLYLNYLAALDRWTLSSPDAVLALVRKMSQLLRIPRDVWVVFTA